MSAAGRFAQPFSEYEISGRLGSGGMGTVFRAHRKSDGAEVAIKVLRPSLSRNTRYVERLRREAEISMRLDHPGLVKGLGFAEEGGYHYIVMEFCPGRTLGALLKNWGRFPEDQVLDLGIQVAEALAYAHENGVVHRDVKPGNLLIDDEGNAKLTDLGLAKAESDPTLTRDGGTVGTPQYMSPEQAESPTGVDERSDLYSLGATLYHMLVGQPPFSGESAVQVIAKLLHERADSAGSLNPEVSEGVNLVLRRLLMKKPDDRYSSAHELLEDLRAVRLGHAPAIDARALAKAEGAGSARPRKTRVFAAAATGVCVALLGVWIWSMLQGQRGDAQPKIGFAKLERAVGDRAQALHARFALLDAYRCSDEAERIEVRSMRSRLLREFEAELTSFHERWSRSELARWIRGIGPDYRDRFSEQQERRLVQRFRGYRAANLPPELRSLHILLQKAEFRILDELHGRRAEAAVAKIRAALTTTLFPAVDRLANVRDFGAAITALDGAAAAPLELVVHGEGEARVLTVEDDRLAAVSQEIRAKRDALVAAARALVDGRRREVEEGLDSARRLHRGGFSERAARLHRSLERKLDGSPPWKSLPEEVVEDRSRLLASLVRDRRAVQDELQRVDLESVALAEDAVHARLAKDLDIDAALALVSGYRFATAEGLELRDALLEDLSSLRRFLVQLTRIVRARAGAGMGTWRLRDGSVEASLHESEAGPPPRFSLRVKGAGLRQIAVGDLDDAWLTELCARGRDAETRRVPLGLLFFFLDRFDSAFAHLRSHRIARYLEAKRRRQALLSRSAETASEQAARKLARIREMAQRPGVLQHNALRAMVQDLETRLGDTRVVQDARDELDAVRARLRLDEQRRQLLGSLEAGLRDAVRLELPTAQTMMATLPFGEAGVFERGIARWRKTSRGLASPPANGTRPEAELESAMSVRLPIFDSREACRLQLQLLVPERGRALELVELEVFGSRVLIACNLGRSGRLLPDPSKDLRKALQAASARPAARDLVLLRGGRVTLRLDLEQVERDARRLRVFLDDAAVDNGGIRVAVTRSGQDVLRLGVIGDIVLERLHVRGQPR